MAKRSDRKPDKDSSSVRFLSLFNGGSVALIFVIGQAGSMLSLLLIAKTISTDDFGKLSSGLAIQNYIVLLGSLGLRTIATRDLARSPDQVSRIWGTLWGLVGPTGAEVAVVGHFIAGTVFLWTPDEMWMSACLSVGAWFSMLSLAPLLDAVGRQPVSVASVAVSEVLFLLTGFMTGRLMWLGAGFALGDRRAKRTHFGELIGVENGPTVAVSGSFESFWFRALGAKDADGGRLRTDQACSS